MRRMIRKSQRKKKKQEESHDSNDPFCRISLDLKIEILMKLPVKSIAKLVFVSKHLASTIRSKEFMDMYMTRPRRILRVHRERFKLFHFHSCFLEDPSSDRTSITLNPKLYSWFSPPVRGLICCRNDAEVLVGNPSTGQFVTLPRVNTRSKEDIYTLFGYEPVNDVYKVLCMTSKVVSAKCGSEVVLEEHQVFTVGGKGKESWRMIKCKHPHGLLHSYHEAMLCMNGAVYYYGWVKGEGSLIRFDLRSEEFNIIKLPEDVRLVGHFSNLVNYNGKIALTSLYFEGALDLRVLDDVSKQEWSKVCAVVPSWRELVGRDLSFSLKGALGSGELLFAKDYSFINAFNCISYDLKENNAKRLVIGETGENETDFVDIFFDHVDSPMVLSNVT